MLAALTAVHIVAGAAPEDEVSDIVEAYTSLPEVAEALGYASTEEAKQRLRGAIEKYVAEPTDRWSALLTRRVDPNSLPERADAARLLVGCAQFGLNLQRMGASSSPRQFRQDHRRDVSRRVRVSPQLRAA